ncbi:N-acetyl-alpha-D-glucosaminyl L-malate synthase BshA [Paradesulfitobacterium ferrireducens]|uniref:N-acetyl-alpha-D-glucosaminyl L-malate synthase BshA n=1 Tax=Paradesulfitobacterium ferrireducens TaxID=2816476 RepID=UPI001A8DB6BB
MKIGMVCYPTYGGSGVVAAELGYILGERGHQVHFISSARPFRLYKYHRNLFFHEVEDVSYPLFKYPPYTLLLANKIVEVTRQVGLELIHVHYAIPHTISAYLAKQMLDEAIPLVTTLHGTDITLVGAYEEFYRLTRMALKVSDGLTAVSHSLAADTETIFGPLSCGIEVVPNFVDPLVYFPRPKNDTERESFAPAGEKLITHISNFREVKHVPDVIRIFERVQRQIPCRLLLVGDGPEMGKVEREVAKRGLKARVLFLGKQENVGEILQMSDVFLLPSAQESFGLAALEAMACGVPVVASRVGGLPEVVKERETGFLLPAGDVEGMSAAVVRLLREPELYERMSAAAAAMALQEFPPERAAKAYEKVYEEASKRVTNVK